MPPAGLPDTVENRLRRVDTTLKRAAVSSIADRPGLNLARLAVAEALAGELPTCRKCYWIRRIHHVSGDPRQAIGYYRQVLGHWAGTRR
jgi:hypothetical protein